MDDKETFAKTWQWAKKNMQRKNIDTVYYWNRKEWVKPAKQDYLLSWRFIPSVGNKNGAVIHYDWIQNEVWRGCFEAASDADVDIAAALAAAGLDWNDPSYLKDAKDMLGDIWNKYVKKVGGNYYQFAGDQFREMGEINPSYLRPAYYKALFPKVDPSHPWEELYRSSYKVVVESGDLTFDGVRGKVNLPPNWIDMTADESMVDSDVFQTQGGGLFGWDAFRTLFSVAQDYAWNATTDAKKYLTDDSCTPSDAGPYCFLKKELDTKGRLLAGYNRDGTMVISRISQANGLNQEQFAMYGVYLPFFYYAGDTKAAQQLLDKLQGYYKEGGYWGYNENEYYAQNWAWFGLALINGEAVNFFDPKGRDFIRQSDGKILDIQINDKQPVTTDKTKDIKKENKPVKVVDPFGDESEIKEVDPFKE